MVAPDVEIDDGKGNFSICFYSLFFLFQTILDQL